MVPLIRQLEADDFHAGVGEREARSGLRLARFVGMSGLLLLIRLLSSACIYELASLDVM